MTDPMKELGELIAGYQPRIEAAKCPKCGGRLTASVTVYCTVPVAVQKWRLPYPQARARYGKPVLDSMRDIEAQVADNYGGGEVDERDDLYCENYDVDGGCDFVTNPVDLESAH